MLFHKEKKLCLFEVPKTGTTSARQFLPFLGWHHKGNPHDTPEQFIERYPNLVNYKFFAFIRDPLDRFGSTIRYVIKTGIHQKAVEDIIAKNGLDRTVKTLSYDEWVDLFDFMKLEPVLFRKQVTWFSQPNTTALDFHNYEAEMRRLCGDYDTTKLTLRVVNDTKGIERGVITDKVRDFVRKHYAEDYALAKDLLGKEY